MSAPATATVCPCDAQCGVVSLKGLAKRSGHVPHCGDQNYGAVAPCRSCLGRRNRERGQRGQSRMHKALGGTGFVPSNEESARPYVVEVSVLPEGKKGQQVPASFAKFVTTEWFRRALSQSVRALPVGAPNVLPAVYLEPSSGGQWLVVKCK